MRARESTRSALPVVPCHPQRMNAAEAETIARELYGLDARATALPGERDLNFRLEAASSRYVLKVHHAGADVALEDAVLAHLDPVPGVPRLAGPTTERNGRVVRLL